ncbi:MAG: DM13 domain-containing protein [Chloroflexi bacterium]|nr:DM13 domain-containing protein [Chloroflexota bacterium]
MEFLGDLERAFATSLYPNRVPIAIGLGIAAIALLWLAWRRRWDLAARRHPRRTLVALAILLAVGVPTAWYLGSPLVIRSELANASTGGTVVAQGDFRGADEFHFGSGQATIAELADGRFVVRFSEFSVLNGPDLFVYVSPDPAGYADGALELGRLKATDGAFEYELPPGTDPAAIRSVVIWCRNFAVQFAVAALAPGA